MKKIKKDNWEVAIGLNKVDGLKPSTYLQKLINESIEGKSSYIISLIPNSFLLYS